MPSSSGCESPPVSPPRNAPGNEISPRAVAVAVSGTMSRGKPMNEAWTTTRKRMATTSPVTPAPRNELDRDGRRDVPGRLLADSSMIDALALQVGCHFRAPLRAPLRVHDRVVVVRHSTLGAAGAPRTLRARRSWTG